MNEAVSYRKVTVQMPAREISTAIMATRGSGPIPYCRSTRAPARNVSCQ